METVVLLHCTGSSGAQWRALAASLARRCRVLAPDLVSGSSLAEVAAALSLPSGPLHLVGHSFGGAVALHIARTRPGRLASLTLFEPTAFHLLGEGDDALREISAVAADVRTALAAGDLGGGFGRFVDYWSGPGAWAEMPAERRAALSPQLAKVALDFQALLLEPAALADMCGIAVPTLLMQGDRTTLAARRVCEHLRVALPDASFRVLAGAGHMGPITHRDIVNALIAAHIEVFAATTEELNHEIHAS